MMHSTTHKTSLPQYLDYSPRPGEYTDGLHLPPSPSRPQYRVFSATQHRQSTQSMHSKSETSTSADNCGVTRSSSKTTPTQDLAEFLRTSSPEDYKKFLKSGSSEDLPNSTPHKRSFRFLRSSSPKVAAPKNTARSPTPAPVSSTVLPKTTSRGKPYLQIHVDYAKTYIQSLSRTGEPDKRASSFLPSSGTSSEFDYHGSSASAGNISTASLRPSSAGEKHSSSRLSPMPWSTRESRVFDTEAIDSYQQFLASQLLTDTSSNNRDRKIRSFSVEAVGGTSDGGIREYRRKRKTLPLKTPPESPIDSLSLYSSRRSGDAPSFSSCSRPSTRPSQAGSFRHSWTKSQEASVRSSVRSEIFEDTTDVEDEGTAGPQQRKQCRKTPPRPGPPPTRSLPSLPEGHDDALSLAGRIRAARNSQISTTDTIASNASEISSITSYSKPVGERGALNERKARVRARKARDMQQIRLQRDKELEGDSSTLKTLPIRNPTPSVVSSSYSRRSSRRNSSIRRYANETINRPSLSPITVILDNEPTFSTEISKKHASINGTPTPPRSPSNYSASSSTEDGPDIPTALPTPPPTLNNTQGVSTLVTSTKHTELEARVMAVERKNRMLEQALLAVIRGGMGHDQNQPEMLQADALENLLKELRTNDVDPFDVDPLTRGQRRNPSHSPGRSQPV